MKNFSQWRRWSWIVLGALSVVCLVGCGKIQKGSEDRDPNIKRARERRAAGDYMGALNFYQQALDKRPGMARVHWEMGSIYDQHLTNELRAIYHYERFLELDPKAERRELVEKLIGAARLSYAASLPARPSEAVQEIARLRKELESTQALLAESREEAARLRAAPGRAGPTTPAAGGAATIERPRPATAQVGSLDTYTVQTGDTLSKIAKKVYNDANKWNVLYEANKATMKRPEDVKVGQTLVVPR